MWHVSVNCNNRDGRSQIRDVLYTRKSHVSGNISVIECHIFFCYQPLTFLHHDLQMQSFSELEWTKWSMGIGKVNFPLAKPFYYILLVWAHNIHSKIYAWHNFFWRPMTINDIKFAELQYIIYSNCMGILTTVFNISVCCMHVYILVGWSLVRCQFACLRCAFIVLIVKYFA